MNAYYITIAGGFRGNTTVTLYADSWRDAFRQAKGTYGADLVSVRRCWGA